jgi:PilZ domain-containing protein
LGYETLRSAPRYSLAVDIELTDLQSHTQLRERTKDLSLFGCGVDTSKPFPKGTLLNVKLSHGDSYVTSTAKVVYCNPELGMGLVFIRVDPEGQRILEEWIAELMSIALQYR